jgi:hypothetical protein
LFKHCLLVLVEVAAEPHVTKVWALEVELEVLFLLHLLLLQVLTQYLLLVAEVQAHLVLVGLVQTDHQLQPLA